MASATGHHRASTRQPWRVFFVFAKQINALSSARHFLGLLALIFTLTDAQRLPVQRATTGVVSFTD
ncbi:hypothetical protein [Pantoea allii]|uniref:hypothetical protein n=1 Tax=Pantoea allii TaxID=574096 RepID=UPI0011429AEB|nr:hypothetical protein [Pantoea allii]MBW1252237.1 hypothetical protein [Pantoea allii]MBW1283824.1 hypothetical protein [Pantoea allii]